ncbi:unnamed protein product [Phytophthora fragariaefolia]|uniref:Unnamed protein product n=1 Tax=Phytophthora fragariaefolia TaxID=1490495 RepID=A0A9W6TLM3_9STRA|nr:unnamed protein product [Phytophthora fragariaefolia]
MAQRYRDQDEHSTSSSCRTESERSSRLSSSVLLDAERQSGKGREQDESQLDRWRMSEARTVSEYSSALSSTRLTRLEEEGIEDDQSNQVESQRGPESSSGTSTQQEAAESQVLCCDSSDCETSSSHIGSALTSSTQSSDGNQSQDQSELSESLTETPPSSSTEVLPRLRPTPPETRVIPNCCDFFPSPHPHYAKEVIGGVKSEGAPLNSPRPPPTSPSSSDTTNQAAEHETSEVSENSRARNESSDDFEMWDYICPQHARRNYANEWF